MTLPTIDAAPSSRRDLRKDLKTLALFIQIYCRHRHAEADKLLTHDVKGVVGRDVALCAECTRLLTHAFVKRTHCPFDPKPMCKHCADHCYHPSYRAQIREVMRYSGRYMVLHGRLDYLWHLLF